MSVIRYTNKIKTLWEKYLRVAFANSVTPVDYRYTSSEATSKIRIYKEAPQRIFNTPLITISAKSGNASLRYVNNEVVKDVNVCVDECIINNTTVFTPLADSITNVYSRDKQTGTKTEYVLTTNYTFDYDTKTFTWVTTQPDSFYASYQTFDVNIGATIITAEYKQKVAGNATQLEFVPTYIDEVYAYTEDNTKIYYSRDEVYTTANDRTLVWTIAEPERYYVTYLTGQVTLIQSAKFVQSYLDVNVTFDIYARSTTDRERITDLLVLYLRHVFKEAVTPYFVYNEITVGGESQEMFDNQMIYKNSVTVKCITHYSHVIDNSLLAVIKSIPIDIDA